MTLAAPVAPLVLYDECLTRSSPLWVEHDDGTIRRLPVERWREPLLPGDETLLGRVAAPALDVGCGPGRLAAALAARELPALGIDVSPTAVRLTRRAGALAIRRDVFARVPGAGRWPTALLADGNIGIGGEPAALLRRIAALLAPTGRALVELAPPAGPAGPARVRLRTPDSTSAWFGWATVGTADIGPVAASAGLRVSELWTGSGRWFAALSQAGRPGAGGPT